MDYTNLAYVFSAVLFILGIKRLSSPKTARNGNAIASTGMLVAIIATLISFDLLDYKLIIIGMGIGGVWNFICNKSRNDTNAANGRYF